MISYEKLSKTPRKFLAMTGYTLVEFYALLPYFAVRYLDYVATHTLDGKPRGKRRYSTYKNSPLPTMEDKLLFILVYLKTYSLQEVQGALFGMAQPVAHKWIHLLLPIVNQALADLGELPARTPEELAIDDEEEELFFHDGTERPIPRPQDPEEQKQYYSGKKKQHTVKNIVIISAICKIIFLSATVEGKKHDKRAADEAGYTLPAGSTLVQDTGFQGFSLENVAILQPKKKPRGGELTRLEKAVNRLIAGLRMRIEHAIGGVKRYRIVKDKLRNWKQGFRDLVFETCAGLHNFRLNFRPWHYDTFLPTGLLIKS